MVSGTGGLGSGTAIRAPESEALHGFVGNGTDGSSISKIIDQKKGLPMAGRLTPTYKTFSVESEPSVPAGQTLCPAWNPGERHR